MGVIYLTYKQDVTVADGMLWMKSRFVGGFSSGHPFTHDVAVSIMRMNYSVGWDLGHFPNDDRKAYSSFYRFIWLNQEWEVS